MSKPNIRKITVDPTKCNTDSRRPSVFERLGTKPPATSSSSSTGQNNSDYCRNWALNGSCSYGKNCKYAITHTLISPSKRVKKDNAPANTAVPSEDPFKRLTSKIVKKTSHSPDLNLEDWNQTDLEYEDEKVLERRRQLLQRELELQMKKDKEVHGKEKITKHKKKAMSSSSSSHSSSTSSSSSSSSSDDSSSSSTSDSRKKVKKVKSKRHHSASSDYDEDRERKKKLKLKRLGTKSEKLVVKKKRKIEAPSKKEVVVKPTKKVLLTSSRKHSSTARAKSPIPTPHASSSKIKERNRSESPKAKSREVEKDKHHKKAREEEASKEIAKAKAAEKTKESEKSKSRVIEERNKAEERSKQRIKEKERRSRTPPIEKSKHQYSKEISNVKSRRSRTPEKPARSKREPTPPRHQEKLSAGRSREIEKKERDIYKGDRGKDKEEVRKNDPPKPRPSSSQEDNHRKNAVRDMEEKNYANERNRQRSKERRDKEHNVRDDRSHSRLGRDQRDSQRDKEREEVQERCRDRQRERDREKEPVKVRERDIPSLMATTAINPMDKNGRYARDKDRFKDAVIDKNAQRDRRGERDRERSEKPMERDRGLQRFDARYDRSLDKEIPPHKVVERERPDRFPRERSLDRIVEKNMPVVAREHVMERENLYERDRHRRFNPRFDRGHPVDHERKEPPHIPPKIERIPDRRDASRRSLEMERNYDRGYARLPPEHWEESEEPQRMDYRDHHPHEDERRKPMEPRRYNSPFDERRARDERPPRYAMQNERPFEDPHLPIFPGDKMRAGPNRDESSNDNWEVHHELEHGNRDRNYQNPEWEEREWRARPPMWDRESPPRSEVHEEEWAPRYDSPMPDWKLNEGRKWENPSLMRGPYRNDRIKEIDLAEIHSKRRPPYGTPELRDECSTHGSKQGSLHGSMKEEPINKKLMELAEGRIRKSREKSVENFQKRMPPQLQPQPQPQPQREKSEVKESPLAVEAKRPCLDESLQTLHTESDLSDISDDPDDILNMEEEEIEAPKLPVPKKGPEVNERDAPQPVQVQEPPQHLSPKEIVEEPIFTKEKDTNEPMEFRNIEEETIENMDFEEISDGELEEDIKTSGKGLGDALGVDWESLVKESQPRRLVAGNLDTAQSRWQCKAIFQRIGISVKYAGVEAVESLRKKYSTDNDSDKFLLDDVALLHTAIVRQQFMNHASRTSSVNDDLFCRNYAEANEDEDEAALQPCTSLYEEAKILLQQVA